MVDELGALFNGALHFLQQCLRDSAKDGLFIYVHSEGLYPSYASKDIKQFSEMESRYLNLLDDRRLGVTGEISHQIYKCSPPNQYLSLTHWRVLLETLSRLSPAERENFRTYKVQMTFEGLPIGPSPIQDYGSMDFVDSHAHQDKLIKNKKVSFVDELEGVMHCGNLHLSKVVANYVYPNLWRKAQEHQRQDMCERIAYTFGIHPHFVKEQNPLEELRELLRDKRCVGLGEVGLDYSGNCRQHQLPVRLHSEVPRPTKKVLKGSTSVGQGAE